MPQPTLTQQVSRPLHGLLAAHRVECFQPRERMLQLNSVPAGTDFSKPCTNVLLREQPAGGAWLVYVDEDLKYRGGDAARQALFGGAARRGWLPLAAAAPVRGDVNAAILWALERLESGLRGASEHDEPCLPQAVARPSPAQKAAEASGLPPLDSALQRVGRRLAAEELLPAAFSPTEAQADAIAKTAAAVLRAFAPRCPLLIGPAGTGKTAVARAAAGELVRRGMADRAIEIQGSAVNAGAIFWPERDERLRQTLETLLATPRVVVLLEQADLALVKSDTAAALLADALDRGLRLIAVARPDFTPRQIRSAGLLRRRLEPVRVAPPEDAELTAILRRRWADQPCASEVELSPDVLPLVAVLSRRRPGGNPGAALGLLEAIVGRAAFGGQRCVGPDDVYHQTSKRAE